jgi:hypothetical protein
MNRLQFLTAFLAKFGSDCKVVNGIVAVFASVREITLTAKTSSREERNSTALMQDASRTL